jgi:hypothetical protein
VVIHVESRGKGSPVKDQLLFPCKEVH